MASHFPLFTIWRVFMARKDPEVTKAYDRARKAAKRAQQSTESRGSRKSRRKKPGKTPFASYVKVKKDKDDNYQIRKSSHPDRYFVDLVIGPLKLPGRLYNWKTGSMQISTSRTETMEISPPFYVNHVRPLIVTAIEEIISKRDGQSYRLPKRYRFTPAPVKSYSRRKNAA
jgi:hypothetical protein